jgi:hypothetical protein
MVETNQGSNLHASVHLAAEIPLVENEQTKQTIFAKKYIFSGRP